MWLVVLLRIKKQHLNDNAIEHTNCRHGNDIAGLNAFIIANWLMGANLFRE
jgi:hypothetical protein